MKTLSVILILFVCATAALADDPEAAFQAAFTKAHAERSVPAFLALVETDAGTPQFIIDQIKESFADDAKLKMKEAKFADLTGQETTSFTIRDVAYVTTLQPVKRFVVSFETAGQGNAAVTESTYLIGVKDGQYRIATATAKK